MLVLPLVPVIAVWGYSTCYCGVGACLVTYCGQQVCASAIVEAAIPASSMIEYNHIIVSSSSFDEQDKKVTILNANTSTDLIVVFIFI